jgi:starvation-inducible DNA-binding protein
MWRKCARDGGRPFGGRVGIAAGGARPLPAACFWPRPKLGAGLSCRVAIMLKTQRKNAALVTGLDTPSDLSKEGREAIADAVNVLVADAFALYIKTKNFHWHMSGSHYRDYHLLLDEQGDQIFTMTDVLAERVRKLGFTTIHSIGHIARLQTIADDDREFVLPLDALKELMNDNKKFAAEQRRAHKVCDEHGDVATASLLEVFIDETERRIWFLYETTTGDVYTN